MAVREWLYQKNSEHIKMRGDSGLFKCSVSFLLLCPGKARHSKNTTMKTVEIFFTCSGELINFRMWYKVNISL